MRFLKPLLLVACMFVTGCGKPPATETPASKPAAVALPPTAPTVATKAVVTETPVPKGPPILTLRATGAILDPDGKPFASRDDVEKFLKEEQARTKAASVPFSAERDAGAITVRQALLLYQRAGFDGVELRETAADDRKGPVVSLLAATTQIAVIVNVNGTGSQANQVREIILKTPAGETGLGRSEWREQLPKAIKILLDGKELISKDACSIQADNRLCYEGLLEVVALCAKAGVKQIVVTAFAKKPGDDAEDGTVDLSLPASGGAKRPSKDEPPDTVVPAKPADVKVVIKSADGKIAELLIRAPGGDTKVGTVKELEELLKTIRPKLRNQTGVTIEADSGLRYAFMIETVDACSRAGFKEVGFAPPPDKDQ